MPGSFFDTNVLLYAVSADHRKADRAEELILQGGTISIQNVNEYVHVARRKFGLSWERLNSHLRGLRAAFDVVPVTVAIHERGLQIAQRYGLSTYDAMIVAAALEAGCDTLWSEDMQDGQMIGTLTIRNPFGERRA